MCEHRTLPARYVFVCGLHRSGTSLLTRLIAAHSEVSALHAPDVPEGEGAYAQGAIPHTARHGVPGEFAFDPEQHLTETHPLNRLDTRERLEADWGPRFEPDKLWRLEKSPVNLLRMRLYQQLFPMAHFIVIVRHPSAVAQATAKWSDRTHHQLLAHWEAAHQLALGDLAWLHAALVLRYEDLCAEPDRVLRQIACFLQLQTTPSRSENVADGNGQYTARMGALPPNADRLGYGSGLSPERPLSSEILCRHPLKSVRHSVLAAARDGGTREA